MSQIGYIRVSSISQNFDRQILKMQNLGIEKIFKEKASGKNTQRPEFQKLLSFVREGDSVTFDSLDRLGRDYDDIKKTVLFFKNKNVEVYFLDAPFLNFNTGNEILDKAMFDMFLSFLSYIAENERQKIKERQKEGIALAKIKKVYKGRPTEYSATSHDPQKRLVYNNIVTMLEKGFPIVNIAKSNKVSRETVYKIKRSLSTSSEE